MLAKALGGRIQEDRGKDLTWRAIFESERALYTVACLAAWPMTQAAVGLPIAFKPTLHEASWQGSAAVYMVKVVVGLLAADAYNYWKHRLLHHRVLWAFHSTHHTFRDPTAFVGFAIHPFEAVLTFWPIVLVCFPQLYLWMPLHAPFIAGAGVGSWRCGWRSLLCSYSCHGAHLFLSLRLHHSQLLFALWLRCGCRGALAAHGERKAKCAFASAAARCPEFIPHLLLSLGFSFENQTLAGLYQHIGVSQQGV